MNQSFFVYILTNQLKTVLYIGVTNNLQQRILEHYQNSKPNSFTSKYKAYFLIYYEPYSFIYDAIAREKELKGWSRGKKFQLINKMNPALKFLNEEVFGSWPPVGFGSRLEN